jgi:deoxyribodipyrimidine photo-lyase
MKKYSRAIVWLRRDLRLQDNRALSEASKLSNNVAVLFVFDSNILDKLKNKEDKRVSFIQETLEELNLELKLQDSELITRYGDPLKEVSYVAQQLKAEALFFNEDYEPKAKTRDKKIKDIFLENKIATHSFKDQIIFSGSEVLKMDGEAYQVFTPYKKAWLNKLKKVDYEKLKTQNHFLPTQNIGKINSNVKLSDLGFNKCQQYFNFQKPGRKSAIQNLNQFKKHITNYNKERDFPFLENGTSGLSVHLRFGTVSIRECVAHCIDKKDNGSQTWLSELIWREFYQMILDKNPSVENSAFKKIYNTIKWNNSETKFKAWCDGMTGFPIIDAGMRQLNQTGWMHNRLRMITASFLVKDLLINWQKGEEYFAEKLLDFDLASNNGGWQWCASTGCDAQPYFRVFNPSLQSQRFDPEAQFIKQWVPELKNCLAKDIHNSEKSDLASSTDYPKPIVNHAIQKDKAIELFKKAK